VNFDYSEKVQELRARLEEFMDRHIYPNEEKWEAHVRSERRWEPVPIIEELKPKAREQGLWNLWRPKSHGGTLTNLEYAPLCEIMGRVHWAPEVFNCSAPDTGNMEILAEFGPALGRPLVDTIHRSRHRNMEELRPGSKGRSEVRILFAFDPRRRAVMLVAGDKSYDWDKWYTRNIKVADDLFDEHLARL
jgi:hypothetical protein